MSIFRQVDKRSLFIQYVIDHYKQINEFHDNQLLLASNDRKY